MIGDSFRAAAVIGQEAEITIDRGVLRGGAREEARPHANPAAEEEAAHRTREDVGKQQAVGVDDGEPRLADAAGRGEVAQQEAAEDVGERVVCQGFRRIHGFCATNLDCRAEAPSNAKEFKQESGTRVLIDRLRPWYRSMGEEEDCAIYMEISLEIIQLMLAEFESRRDIFQYCIGPREEVCSSTTLFP
jgi:hypothetical protein